ncbi:MAG: hypothetical protein ACK559_20095 [bacterium]
MTPIRHRRVTRASHDASNLRAIGTPRRRPSMIVPRGASHPPRPPWRSDWRAIRARSWPPSGCATGCSDSSRVRDSRARSAGWIGTSSMRTAIT